MVHDNAPGCRRVISIRWIISAAVVFLTTLIVSGVAIVGERNTRVSLTREVGTRLMFEARNLALLSSRALLSEYPELILQPILREMEVEQEELVFAAVLDQRHIVQAHTEAERLGHVFSWPSDLVAHEISLPLDSGEMLLANGDLLVASSVVMHPTGEPIGIAALGFERDYIDSVVRQVRQQQLVVVSALLVLGIVTATLLISWLLRPIDKLKDGLERIGRGDLDTPVELRDRTEFGLLAETMNWMAARVRTAQVDLIKKEHLAREMALARDIQSSLLPDRETRAGEFVIGGAHRAATEVGGDYYDVFVLPDGRIGVAIADVAGKGLAGCMVTSMLAALLRAFRLTETDPTRLVVQLETALSESLRRGTFITMFYGLLDPLTGRLECVSAGHLPTLVYRAATGAVERLRSRGTPIGAVRGALEGTLSAITIELERGDLLIQYTDGINEAFSPEGEQFGFERLGDAVRKAAPGGCQCVIDAIRTAVKRWSGTTTPADDETLLVLSRELEAPAAVTPTAAVPDAVAAELAATQLGDGEARRQVLELLAAARARNDGLVVQAGLRSLTRVRDWLPTCAGYGELQRPERILVEIALWEACANIIEHGYEENESCTFEILSTENDGVSTAAGGAATAVTSGGTAPVLRFLIVDQGHSFRPLGWQPVDFTDPSVRRRGRGLGLELIHTVMSRVQYHPGTPDGNVTVLEFDGSTSRGKVEHVE